MKLKNTLVASENGQRKLTVEDIRKIFAVVTADALAVPIKVKPRTKKVMPQVLSESDETTNGMRTWPARVAACYALTKHEWANKKGIKERKLFPVEGHAYVKSPKIEGRSRFSRPALRLIRVLILEGQKPSEFLHRLKTREPELLEKIGMDVLDAAPLRGKKNGETAAKTARRGFSRAISNSLKTSRRKPAKAAATLGKTCIFPSSVSTRCKRAIRTTGFWIATTLFANCSAASTIRWCGIGSAFSPGACTSCTGASACRSR